MDEKPTEIVDGKPIEEKDEETQTQSEPLETQPTDTSEIDAGIGSGTKEEPCDPTTMSCDEMRDKIMDLSEQRAKYTNTIQKLTEVKTDFPSEDLDKVYNEAVEQKKKVDNEIYGTFEKFSICARPKPPEPEDQIE